MTATSESRFEREPYLHRIRYTGPTDATAAVLAGLHQAHVGAIPFENIDVIRGRPIRLDLASLQGKLVAAGRGGYCFEQNGLFRAALEDLGFPVLPLAARVRVNGRFNPRTHMLMLVDAESDRWLTDVGFGGDGPLRPVPFGGERESIQGPWTFRVHEESTGLFVLQVLTPRDPDWRDLYAFTLEPQHLVDYEMANHYTSTHPQSRFRQTLTAQRTTPRARFTLRDQELIIDRGTEREIHAIADDDALRHVFAETFGMRFPGTMRLLPAKGRARAG